MDLFGNIQNVLIHSFHLTYLKRIPCLYTFKDENPFSPETISSIWGR